MLGSKQTNMWLALPSKGELEKPTLDFLASCGLKVWRPNERQYVASIPSLPKLQVLFQRVPDIYIKVDEGSVDLGITGYDVLLEQAESHSNTLVIYDNLGFGQCELVLAVPESWVDVSDVEDLAEVTLLFKEKGRVIRIATKYPNSVKQWLFEKGIVYFSLVEAQGALEAAPGIGYADMIADITTTGTTLRENRLKRLSDGIILKSQACLIGNKKSLSDKNKLRTVRVILETIEAYQRAKNFITITANIKSSSPESIAKELLINKSLAGIRGPTISKVYSKFPGDEEWFAVTIVIEQLKLIEVIDHLRTVGCVDIAVHTPKYLFDLKSWNYEGLLEQIKKVR